MKTLLNGLISIIICGGIIFGLQYAGIIDLNLKDKVTDGELDNPIGYLDNTNMDEITTGDIAVSTGNIEDTEMPSQPVVTTISYPYNGSGAITGDFSFVGNQASGNAVYVYRVRQGGYRGGIETRWLTFAQQKSIPASSTISYTDDMGKVIGNNQALTPSQLVFLEVSGYNNTSISGTSVDTGTVTTNLSATIANLAPSCQAYYNFFQCAVKLSNPTDKTLIYSQLVSYMDVLGSLSPDAQNTKCTGMIYDTKTSIAGSTGVSSECIAMLQE